MACEFDMVVRGGIIADGSGSPRFEGDVAIRDGWIVAVGSFDGKGAREIDAAGLLVTPGFIDLHTHYDGQMIWSKRLNPSSDHGVTTVVTGNCGIGFAPCRPADRAGLISLMEGVEDIPGAVAGAGLSWDWESFPEFLDAVDRRSRDIDVATLLPHAPMRVFVMGKRALDREAATAQDLEQMKALAQEALAAGALGVGTSQLPEHRSSDGKMIPTFGVSEVELRTLAEAIRNSGSGIFQFVGPILQVPGESLDLMARMADISGGPVTYTLTQTPKAPDQWREVLDRMGELNVDGRVIKAQLFPRPIGLIIGLTASVNPFCMAPSWAEIADLPLADKVARMREPGLRRRLIDETPENPNNPLFLLSRNFGQVYQIDPDRPDYEPRSDESIASRAAAAGIGAADYVYDLLLGDEGNALLLVAISNYAHYNLDFVREMLPNPNVVLGLGDGGAHYGMICDASYPTFMLAHWARDRKSERFSVEQVVHFLSRKPAELFGLTDRGLIAEGHRASLNIIDLDRLHLQPPRIVYDLPGGGKRLDQQADGYVATIVNGEVIQRNGEPTGAVPGLLVRGRQQARVAEPALATA
jgi:N-acyl-D-amino-acid deacylase